MFKIEPGFWNCCKAKPAKIVAFDDDRDNAPKDALVWHYACNSCASTVHPSRVMDTPFNSPVTRSEGGQETGAKYVAGDILYFCPSIKRMPHGSNIPAGMVEVIEIVDHGTHDPTRDRWTYVVKQKDKPFDVMARQGAAEEELHFWLGGN